MLVVLCDDCLVTYDVYQPSLCVKMYGTLITLVEIKQAKAHGLGVEKL